MPENPKKQKFSFCKKIFFVLLFALSFSCFPIFTKPANAWLEPMAAVMKQGMEEISAQIKGMIMGSLKQAAIKMLSKQMDRFISGTTSNGARFITNWQDYLIDNPTRNAQRYANDYISRAMSGRGSASYKKASNSVLGASTVAGEGFGKEAVLGDATDLYADESSYQQRLSDMLQIKVIDPPEWQAYAGDPGELFTLPEGLTSPTVAMINNYADYIDNGEPTAVKEKVDQIYQDNLKQEQTVATTEATSNSGFISEKVNGIVEKPGILFEQMQANVDNLPNLAMSSATSIGELVAATVSKAISGAISKTVSGVENAVNREVNKVTDKAVQQVNKKVNAYGPGALYKK